MALQVEPEECPTHLMANGPLRAAIMVLTAASTSYAAGLTILPSLANSNGNNGSFLLTVNPSTLTILQGAWAPSTVTVFSISGSPGRIPLSPIPAEGGVGLFFKNSPLSLASGAAATTLLTVN